MNAFARSLCLRSLVVTAASALLALTIVVVTDEAASSAAMRVARLSAAGPVLASLGAFAVTVHARSRGELRSLEALGLSPAQAASGAVVAAWAAGVASLAVLLSPLADVTSLFPAVHPVVAWAVDRSLAIARAPGVSVFADGSFAISASHDVPHADVVTAWSALPCLLPIALLGPVWAVEKLSAAWRVLSLFASGAVAIVALHFIAAHRVSPVVGFSVALPLLAAAVRARAPNRAIPPRAFRASAS